MTILGGADIYGKSDEKEAIATIHRSLELGGNFLDTADLYGPHLNEQLIAKAIAGKRDQYIIATKFGYEIDDNGKMIWKLNASPDYIRKSIDHSLKIPILVIVIFCCPLPVFIIYLVLNSSTFTTKHSKESYIK